MARNKPVPSPQQAADEWQSGATAKASKYQKNAQAASGKWATNVAGVLSAEETCQQKIAEVSDPGDRMVQFAECMRDQKFGV